MQKSATEIDNLQREYRDFYRITQWLRKAIVDFPPEANSEFDPGDGWHERVVKDVEYVDQGNAVSSEINLGVFKGKHMLFLDLDIDHVYMPSSTPGHAHLIVHSLLSQESMQEILDVLAKHGIIQEGFAEASKHRKAAWLRVPWFKKWHKIEEK